MAVMNLQPMEERSGQENVALVKELYAAFVKGDVPTILNLLAEDVDWLTPGPSEMPFSGQRFGRQQVAEFFKVCAETVSVEDQRPEIEEIIAQNDKVVVVGHERGRFKANGQPYEGFWIHVFTIQDHKIVKRRHDVDTAAFLQASGNPD